MDALHLPGFLGVPSVVDLTGTTAFPSLGYALAVLAGGNALLALLAFLAMGRRDIDVLKSV